MTASLVLIAAVSGGVWMLRSPGEAHARPATTASAKAGLPWDLPYTQSGRTFNTLVRGVWFTDRVVVKALPDGIAGLDRATGKRVWGFPTPGSGTVLCQASTDSTGNIAVLAYGMGEECHTFYAVDLSSGKTLWEHDIPAAGWTPGFRTRIARSKDTVVVSAAKHLTTAFRVSDGKQLWSESRSLYDGKDCKAQEYTGGTQLLRVQYCYSAETGLETPYDLAAVDPANGHTQWTYRLSEQGLRAKVLSTSPIVIHVPDTTLGSELRMSVLTDDGKLRTRLTSGPEKRYTESDGSTPAVDVQVKGDKIAMTVSKGKTDPRDNNKMIAWSLDSGKRLWEKESAGRLQAFHPVTSGSPDILSYTSGSRTDGATLTKFDPVTGQQTVLHRYQANRSRWIGIGPLPLIDRGTLYLSAGFVPEVPGFEKEKYARALIALPTK
ncbi:outer membrane protein assembly factor BamB family protein [Streptomyces syringium]|uniref:outer membrane protein assembly factor BamB family protein n=1 Tax=Streptomyces syringium TaxID=76729 RepID=UPI00340A6776